MTVKLGLWPQIEIIHCYLVAPLVEKAIPDYEIKKIHVN
jgi:hypothetical protein